MKRRSEMGKEELQCKTLNKLLHRYSYTYIILYRIIVTMTDITRSADQKAIEQYVSSYKLLSPLSLSIYIYIYIKS